MSNMIVTKELIKISIFITVDIKMRINIYNNSNLQYYKILLINFLHTNF